MMSHSPSASPVGPKTHRRKAVLTDDPDFLLIPHPGKTLREDFMEPLGLTYYAVAKAIGSTPITVSMIANGKRAVSPEMALRLARYTGTSAEFWINLQAHYDLRTARRKSELKINARVVPLPAGV